MELKTKYQYTYFIYPYIVEQKSYANYLYRLLKNKKCKLKIFNRKKDIEIDTYFLPEIKEKMFWTMDLSKETLKDYQTMDKKLQANLLSKKPCCFFEYTLQEDIPAKIGEEKGIFFDISKIEIICFSTGICYLLLKTVLNTGATLSDILNFNYKFRDIHSKKAHTKEYENIKIQTQKLDNMQKLSQFMEEIVGPNLEAKQINLDSDRLITYGYACLDIEDWNENTDIKLIEKEFQKYCCIKPAGEQIDENILSQEKTYKQKYIYYGFTSNTTMLLTSASNIKNYTQLLFQYETVQLYHFLYNLHQKIYLNKINYQFTKTKKFEKVKKQFLEFAQKDWIYEVTNDITGVTLGQYYKQAQNLETTFWKLKNEYDLLYKESEVGKTYKQNKYIIAIIAIIAVLNLVNACSIFKIFG